MWTHPSMCAYMGEFGNPEPQNVVISWGRIFYFRHPFRRPSAGLRWRRRPRPTSAALPPRKRKQLLLSSE
eukprot:9410045-Pyramimonas_sp.AAC.1